MQDSVVEEMEGVEVTETEVDSSPLMTEQEKRILEVYDRLEELQLEIALLRARGILSKDEPVEATEEDIKLAEQDLLKAKALYQVRTNIVENVLVANPILKAVHAGSNASIIEQDLLPLIQQRDELSRTLSKLSSKALSAENELMEIESEHMITAQKNVELATHMLSLADQAKAQKNGDIDDPRLRARLEELDTAMRASRQRWRILKGTASATIAGSGADWARDPKLLEIVMDDDDDDDDD